MLNETLLRDADEGTSAAADRKEGTHINDSNNCPAARMPTRVTSSDTYTLLALLDVRGALCRALVATPSGVDYILITV